jgi:hypothetical protein
MESPRTNAVRTSISDPPKVAWLETPAECRATW